MFISVVCVAGMPASAQQQLGRRSSMNVPKPPPPVRRSSSITSAQNPTVLQKFRNSPPRQMGPPPAVSSKPLNPNQQGNHRRSLSASGGSEPEHAYAELAEIQASIQARQQQGNVGLPGVMSAPVTPQYAQPVTAPPGAAGLVNNNVLTSLNTRFAAMNSVNSGQQGQNGTVGVGSHGNQSNCVPAPGDLPDLPPPPSEDELRQMEQIYSVPKQNLHSQTQQQQQQQQQAYNAQQQQYQHYHGGVNNSNSSVQMRHPQSHYQQAPSQPGGHVPHPGPAQDMRQSLISEMKTVNKLRKMSSSEGGSEC